MEKITLCFSDQQIVTGFAILIAGYCEMLNTNLSVYHWNVIVYLAWLSSSVHIASLKMLRDKLNKNHRLRNFRIAAMLALLFLLSAALWPSHRSYYSGSDMSPSVPVKCLWKPHDDFQTHYVTVGSFSLNEVNRETDEYRGIEPNWVISCAMLFGAYVWKISQLFTQTRNWSREWLRAKPEAAIERSLRLLANNNSFGLSRWVTWPAYKLMVFCYIVFVVYMELAESFMATIIFMCLTVPWGVVNIFEPRAQVHFEVRQGEMTWSFGQIIPWLMLVLTAFSLFESDKTSPDAKSERTTNTLPKKQRQSTP